MIIINWFSKFQSSVGVNGEWKTDSAGKCQCFQEIRPGVNS